MDNTWNIYYGFRMTKFKFSTLPRRSQPPVATNSIPRKTKNKSELKMNNEEPEEQKLVFHSK